MNSIMSNSWIQNVKNKYENMKKEGLLISIDYKCKKCEDTGRLFDSDGNFSWCECKIKQDAIERLEKSGLADRVKNNKFKNYKQDNKQRKEAVETCLNYLADFKSKRSSLLLMGQVGAGKTHLAIATANKLLSEYVVKYVLYEEIKELRYCYNDREHYNKVISNLTNVQILFIDDLFKGLEKNIDPSTAKSELSVVYEIINYRYNNKKPIIITTELSLNRMMQIDEAIASRIIEMCGDYVINFNGRDLNYRIFGER